MIAITFIAFCSTIYFAHISKGGWKVYFNICAFLNGAWIALKISGVVP